MSVIFDAAADRLLRTTNLPAGAFTVSFWVYLISDLNAYSAFFYIGGDNYGGTYQYIGTNATGTALINAEETAGTNLSTGTWYYVAYAFQSGPANRAYTYLGTLTTLAAQDIQSGLNPGQPTTTRMEMGAVGTGNNDRANIRIANIKMWSSQLSLVQVQAEQFSIRPLDTTNLIGWWPCFPGSGERARDYSGLARDWTEGGTLTDGDHPPVSYGAPIDYISFVSSGGTGYNQTLASSLGISSLLLRNTNKIFSSSLAPSATINKNTNKIFSSSISPSSILSASKTLFRTLTSNLGMNSVLTKNTRKLVSSSINLSTLLAKTLPTKILSSILSFNSGYGLRFYGSGNSSTVNKVYITCNPSDTINVGQSNFTIEFWCKAANTLQDGTATAGANYSWINSPIIFDRDLIGSVGSGGDWGIAMTNGRITFGLENSTGSQRTIIGSTDLRDSNWHHVAVTRTRSNGDMAIYVDGTREAIQTSGPSGDVHIASDSGASTYNRYICLGGEKHALDWPQGQWAGYLDELRISNSIRYTGTFYTVPSVRFSTDANTVALYHMDEGTGTVLIDATGNANGNIVIGGVPSGPEYFDSTIQNNLLRNTGKILSSLINISTSVTKQSTKILSAIISPVSALTKNTRKVLASSITSSSTISAIKSFLVVLSSSIGINAIIVKNTSKPFISSITPSSVIIKNVRKELTSNITLSSILSSNKTLLKVLSSVLNINSDLKNFTTKTFSGIIIFNSILAKNTEKSLISGITLSTLLNKNVFKSFTSSITFTGNLVKVLNKVLSSTISISSTLSRGIFKHISSTLTLIGSLIINNIPIITVENGNVFVFDNANTTVNVNDVSNSNINIFDND